MAKSVIRLEDEEVPFFHANYVYMWKKLNTAPYYVNGNGEMPRWIKAPELLPSYVNLSKCMNSEFVPSMNIVNKIIAFYNANITPEVTAFQFLHEKLESTDDKRHTGQQVDTGMFSGLYYGYYFSGNPNRKEVYGAVIKVFEANGQTGVQMIAGISDLTMLKSVRLRNLFAKNNVSMDDYNKYRDSLDIGQRRTTLYKGVVTAANDFMYLQMQGADRENNLVYYNCVTSVDNGDEFLGGIGLMTFVNGKYDVQLLKMAIEKADRKDLKPFDFSNEDLIDMLSIEKRPNEHIHLSLQENARWHDMIIINSSNR